ncbi:unnamed protein product [Medioppia subpectinata]|uniref:Uncharacterized protein n=1 Tax=Medioppia subpectinata TaxID=1979941 RepID=A0A7R9Q7V1_9ACAR|nr:unnamed protein product [Medioppia subpectinata]CAG2114684.1 unnamed protein product [Medioppia subpectinata]
MEERRSVHSLHSLRTSRSHPGPRPLSDISFIDEEVSAPSPIDYPYAGSGGDTHYQTTRTPVVPVSYGNAAVTEAVGVAAKLRHQQSLNLGSGVGSPAPGLGETAPLLAKEPQMERSRSAPFASSMHPIAANLQYNNNQTSGANQRHMTPGSAAAAVAARQTAALNNPLVQGYHLLAEPNRIHETMTDYLYLCISLVSAGEMVVNTANTPTATTTTNFLYTTTPTPAPTSLSNVLPLLRQQLSLPLLLL